MRNLRWSVSSHEWCTGLTLAVSLGACSYDLDPLFEHEVADAGSDTSVGPALSSQQLISAWIGHNPQVDADCIACAEQNCAAEDGACRGDPSCLAYTMCVGSKPNPAGQTECRETFASWVRASDTVRERDLNGPYGQCVFRYKCATECDGNNDLSCLQAFTWSTTPSPTVPLHLFLVDASQQTIALPDASVRVCAAADTPCDNPLGSGKTDAKGLVELQLPTSFAGSFTGFLEIKGQGLYPTLLKFSWNIGKETTYLAGIVNESLFKQSIGAIGLQPDAARGMLQLRMLGCGGVGVKGASFSADRQDAQSAVWYIDVLPKLEATATNAVGSGGIVDVPTGSTLVTATRAADGVQLSRADAPVRANTMTVVVLAPNAAQ
jgi:hypothetical protein